MSDTVLKTAAWKNSNIQVVWGEIAPCDHLVQFYEHDKYFMESLEGFAGCGLLSVDIVVILATKAHLADLRIRLINQCFDIDKLAASDQYITLDADDALAAFMVNNWPDEKLFNYFVSQVLLRARKNQRKVRAFGEVVAVLWEQGNSGATVQVENLWHRLHGQDNFTLYCAYPKSGFTQNASESIDKLCETHSKIIDGQAHPSTEIYYRTLACNKAV